MGSHLSGRLETLMTWSSAVSRNQEDVLIVNATDNSPKLIPEKSSQVWRGFFGVSERMISLSVITVGEHQAGLVSEENANGFRTSNKASQSICAELADF